MKRSLMTGLLILIAITAGGVGFWLGMHHVPSPRSGGDDDDDVAPASSQVEAPPVATVQTIPLAQGTIQQTITAYGSIIAQPGDVRIISVAFESRIGRVSVSPGQSVSPGTPLVELSASPDALVALAEARNAADGANQDLERTQQRFNDHLATYADLAAAQQARQSAQLKLKSMINRGVGEAQTLKCESAGIVSKIDVQEGQIVAAGNPLVEIASGRQIEASLGVEPSDAAELSIGQPVELSRVGEEPGKPMEGKVRVIGRRVDPSTRLVNVTVSLPPDSHLLLDTFITGKVVLASSRGLIVPRRAVIQRADGSSVIYTVENGAAKAHAVRLGLENDQDSQIIAADLKPGDPVVVVNNAILEDGMKVQASSAASPATLPTEESP